MPQKRKRRATRKSSSLTRASAQERRDLFWRGYQMVVDHPLFEPLTDHVRIISDYTPDNLCPATGMAVVTSEGEFHVNISHTYEPPQWAYALAHCLLHLAFGHFNKEYQQTWKEWNAACDCYIARFLFDVKFGERPLTLNDALHMLNIAGLTIRNEERLYEEFCLRGIPQQLLPVGTAGISTSDMHFQTVKRSKTRVDWQACFSAGLQRATNRVVNEASGGYTYIADSKIQRAKRWFLTNFPLLGSLAVSFEVIEDSDICRRLSIRVAAVDMQARVIYINPGVGLNEQELRFVMAHELLHVGLRHDTRCRGRDPYLWNVACDFVINSWLTEMDIGDMPAIGALYDPTLKDMSAEAIYDIISRNVRHFRKLLTMRGYNESDILVPQNSTDAKTNADLDDFYRSCLYEGLQMHQSLNRGYLPADLIEEIQALKQPAIPWDVELAQWFETHFRPMEKVRSYARMSRRQSATPTIPRPLWTTPYKRSEGHTFGVVLDTSGSMDSKLLAKALGAIASYSMAHEVPAARVVFCDAAAYDQGYMPPEQIATKVKVRGRGGTILQPGIDLLEYAEDFPKTGPVLVITDGLCDRLRIRRDHAFLIPNGHSLPFSPVGPVFKVK